jgi:multidrug efflux system membrane fusion protein
VLKNRLVVPTQAVQRGSIGTFVVVVKPDNTVKTQRVQLDAVDGDWQAVQAIQGELKPGDRIVTDGADRLRDGSRVEVVKSTATTQPSTAPPSPGSASSEGARPTPNLMTSPEGTRRSLPPEIAEKVKNMSPEERKAFFQRLRERREAQGASQ